MHAADDTYSPQPHVDTSTGAGRFNRLPTPPARVAGGAARRVATEILRAWTGLAEIDPVLRRDTLLTTQLFGDDCRPTADLRPRKARTAQQFLICFGSGGQYA